MPHLGHRSQHAAAKRVRHRGKAVAHQARKSHRVTTAQAAAAVGLPSAQPMSHASVTRQSGVLVEG